MSADSSACTATCVDTVMQQCSEEMVHRAVQHSSEHMLCSARECTLALCESALSYSLLLTN
eukprot:4854-Heterococcus_DN1.PRE.1